MTTAPQYQQLWQHYVTTSFQQDCVDFSKGATGHQGCTKAFCKDRHFNYKRNRRFCFQYDATGFCLRGAACPYRHCGTRLLKCKYFLNGTCKSGNGCLYSHGVQNSGKVRRTKRPIGHKGRNSEARELTSGDHQVPASTFQEASVKMENVKEKLAEARAKVIAYQQARKAVSPLAHLAEAELRAKVLASMTPKAAPATTQAAEATIAYPSPSPSPAPKAGTAEGPLPATSSSKKRCREEDSDVVANKKAKLQEKPEHAKGWAYTVVVIPQINCGCEEDDEEAEADFEVHDLEA